MIKPDKISAASDLKEKLLGHGEKVKNLSKEMQLKSLMLAYEKFFLYDLENMTTKTFATELNKNFSKYGLISFSCETKIDNIVALISRSNKLKFNLKKDAFKVHNQTLFIVTRDNVLNFGILCTQKIQKGW